MRAIQEPLYSHRQFGLTLVVALGAAAVGGIFGALVYPEAAAVPLSVAAVCLVVGGLLCSLLVEVTDDELRWSFGPGIVHKRVAMQDIRDVEVTQTRIWEGWGIHLTTRGWLYNVAGFQAVAVRMHSGKRFLLGSDEPQLLAAAIRSHIRPAVPLAAAGGDR